MNDYRRQLLAWVGATSLLAFLVFGVDKFLSRQASRRRVSEFQLLLLAALGGWPGGLLAMLVFRHKTAKPSFWLKYALAFLLWAGLLYCVLAP